MGSFFDKIEIQVQFVYDTKPIDLWEAKPINSVSFHHFHDFFVLKIEVSETVLKKFYRKVKYVDNNKFEQVLEHFYDPLWVPV